MTLDYHLPLAETSVLNPVTSEYYPVGSVALATSIEVENITIQESIRPSVVAEIAELHSKGISAEARSIKDPYALSPEAQGQVDATIAHMESVTETAKAAGESNPDILYDTTATLMPAVNEGHGAWKDLRKKALALGPLYRPDAATLGVDVKADAFDEKLFQFSTPSGALQVSAIDLYAGYMRKTGKTEEEIASDISRHASFVERANDQDSEAFFRGCMDGRSIRTRAEAAMGMVSNHIMESSRAGSDDLVSVSLASGAAAPVYKLVEELEGKGNSFKKVVLADIDPMALAAAHAMAPDSVKDKVELQVTDLVRADLTEAITPNSADVVDILGLFEYFPDTLAAKLLERARTIVRPGGYIIFGNMLDDRPQQAFFKDVVQWPKLYQRQLSKTLSIVEKAGYPLDNVEVVVPSVEGVYAVVGIKIPEDNVIPLPTTDNR